VFLFLWDEVSFISFDQCKFEVYFVWYKCCYFFLFWGAIGLVNVILAFHSKPVFVCQWDGSPVNHRLLDIPFQSSFPNGVFWLGSWVHWHSILILLGRWWFLPFSCFCCLSIWLCVAESMLLSGYLSFLLLWFDISHPLMVLFAFIFYVQNFLYNLLMVG
jgi:hypothetical protein